MLFSKVVRSRDFLMNKKSLYLNAIKFMKTGNCIQNARFH